MPCCCKNHCRINGANAILSPDFCNRRTPMHIGYARVSTQEQTLALQQDALHAAKCEQIFTDTISGAATERPGLENARSHLRAGDTLVVWRLDRLGRSL